MAERDSMPFPVPSNPKIYHITHVDNLAGMLRAGYLWSDRERLDQNLICSEVGMNKIKKRRLEEIVVKCHPGTKVGEYVPFYFCPRSIMLYILHKANHPEVTYRGGQSPIVHLQCDLDAVIGWAEHHGVKWACSDRNASAEVAMFQKRRADLTVVNWPAVANTDFRNSVVSEGKQAEFLIHRAFPWGLVEMIGVHNEQIQAQIQAIIQNAGHRTPVTVQGTWYY